MSKGADTVESLLSKGAIRLEACGIDSSRLDAEVLLAHALGMDRSRLLVKAAGGGKSDIVPADVAATYRRLVKRRCLREPLAYVVGRREFWSLDLEVGPEVLIPRPETEVLVREALSRMPPPGTGPVNLVDVGTGSGAIAVALATERPDVMVMAVDISRSALEVARRNARRHAVGSRVFAIQGDLLSGILERPKEFPPVHMVVSNPPYIGTRERDSLMPEVKNHEPEVALYSGRGGEEALRELVRQAARLLEIGGWLLLEIAPGLRSRVVAFLEDEGLWQDIEIVNDYSGVARVIAARRTGVKA